MRLACVIVEEYSEGDAAFDFGMTASAGTTEIFVRQRMKMRAAAHVPDMLNRTGLVFLERLPSGALNLVFVLPNLLQIQDLVMVFSLCQGTVSLAVREELPGQIEVVGMMVTGNMNSSGYEAGEGCMIDWAD